MVTQIGRICIRTKIPYGGRGSSLKNTINEQTQAIVITLYGGKMMPISIKYCSRTKYCNSSCISRRVADYEPQRGARLLNINSATVGIQSRKKSCSTGSILAFEPAFNSETVSIEIQGA